RPGGIGTRGGWHGQDEDGREVQAGSSAGRVAGRAGRGGPGAQGRRPGAGRVDGLGDGEPRPEASGGGHAGVLRESGRGPRRGRAAAEELLGSETINVSVPSGAWDGSQLRLEPILIAPYWWWWWWRWCREFVIRGRVICPDGRPVPAAEVCAYDVDWWFIWSS